MTVSRRRKDPSTRDEGFTDTKNFTASLAVANTIDEWSRRTRAPRVAAAAPSRM